MATEAPQDLSTGAQFQRAGVQLKEQWLGGLRRLGRRDVRSMLLTAAVVYGIAGDFLTTSLMMHFGLSEESNPTTLAIMGVIGVVPAIALLSLLALVLVIGGLGTPAPSPYGVALKFMALVILLAKCLVVTSNLLVWLHPDYMGIGFGF